MEKIELNEEGLMQKVGELLRQQPYYSSEMNVVPAPPGTTGITGAGYDVTGGVQVWEIADLEFAVRRQYAFVRTKPLLR